VGRRIGGGALVGIALFMLLGFIRTDLSMSDPTVLMAFLLTVAGPAAVGTALLRGRSAERLPERREALRRQVVEAEILRLAAARGNRITVVELVTELSLPADGAKDTLDDMMRRGLADIEVTDTGGIVYTFPDLHQLRDRDSSRGLLE
jgi:hypothetical protein